MKCRVTTQRDYPKLILIGEIPLTRQELEPFKKILAGRGKSSEEVESLLSGNFKARKFQASFRGKAEYFVVVASAEEASAYAVDKLFSERNNYSKEASACYILEVEGSTFVTFLEVVES